MYGKQEELGTVSFNDHRIVLIDTYTHEQAYENGFDYQPELYDYNFYSVDYSDHSYPFPKESSYKIHLSFDKYQSSLYADIYKLEIPCGAEKLELKMDIEEDGTLVFTPLADGKPCTEGSPDKCLRFTDLTFLVANAVSDSYHVKWNPRKMLVTGDDGIQHEEIVYDYEGDISIGEVIDVTLPDTRG